jgi:hypothetical protein
VRDGGRMLRKPISEIRASGTPPDDHLEEKGMEETEKEKNFISLLHHIKSTESSILCFFLSSSGLLREREKTTHSSSRPFYSQGLTGRVIEPMLERRDQRLFDGIVLRVIIFPEKEGGRR